MTPESLADRYSAADLPAQFVLSRGRQVPGWHHDAIGGWHLSVEEKLPCRRVSSADGPLGWVLGHPVGPDGQAPGAELILDPAALESDIYACGGRFVVLLPLQGRVYLDPGGLLSAVYCPHQGLVASTPALIPYDERTPDRLDLLEAMGIPEQNGMFPVGMTAREGVERILPNHYLDLTTWQIVRHWPAAPLRPRADVDAAVAGIADICRRQIGAALDDGPAALRLTGGKDSRMLLACAREHSDRVECISADLRDEMSEVDCAVAKRVSRRAGIPHRVLRWVPPADRDLELWLHTTGFSVGEKRAWRGTSTYLAGLDPGRADIHGVAGEIARGFWWQPDDAPDSVITTDRLRQHAKCPATPETDARLETWQSGAVAGDALQLLDLFYVEQRLGCWAGVVAGAEAAYSRQQVFPLAHRRIFELMMRLPVEYRRDGALQRDVIAREWPELNDLPFNTPSMMHGLMLEARAQGRRLQRAVANPGPVIARRLRR